jgi:hypothetical protein
MGLLRSVIPDRRVLLQEIEDFRAFLSGKPRAERSEFLPFFAAHDQLCAYLATINGAVPQADSVAHEFSLWGDFVCDMVSGSKQSAGFVFVEFEECQPRQPVSPGRQVSRWGARVEAGISQVTDWLFRLDSARNSSEMEREFGQRQVRPLGIIVAGRRSEVSPYDQMRLNLRSEHTVIGGSKVVIMTYDDLLEWMDGRASLVRTLDEEGEEQRSAREGERNG